MDDLISRAATAERMVDMAGCGICQHYGHVKCRACSWNDAMNIVDEMPAVDAAPVVHGRPVWINPLDPGAKICTWKCSSLCSACGEYVAVGWKHCQNCGAKMDGERRDDDATD